MADNIVAQIIPCTWPVVVSDPAAPACGDPVRFGSLTGIAVNAEGSAGLLATETMVDFGMYVADHPVNDHGGAGIAAGDPVFYVDAADRLENDSAGYFYGFALEAVGNGATTTIQVLHVPSPGAGTLGAGTVGAANLAALAVEHAKIALAAVEGENIAQQTLTADLVATSANADVHGALPILYHAAIADASADTDILVEHKVKVVDFWIVNRGAAAHATDDHVQLFNGADAISDEVAKTATVHAIKRAATLDDDHVEIAAGGTMRFTAVKSTNVQCEAYVLCYPVA